MSLDLSNKTKTLRNALLTSFRTFSLPQKCQIKVRRLLDVLRIVKKKTKHFLVSFGYLGSLFTVSKVSNKSQKAVRCHYYFHFFWNGATFSSLVHPVTFLKMEKQYEMIKDSREAISIKKPFF